MYEHDILWMMRILGTLETHPLKRIMHKKCQLEFDQSRKESACVIKAVANLRGRQININVNQLNLMYHY